MSASPHPPVDPRTLAALAADTKRAIARSLDLPHGRR